MSLEYKYFTREFANKEALQSFIEDELNRPDSLDEIVSVIGQPEGAFLVVGRTRRQAPREARPERAPQAREHERFQNNSHFQDNGQRRQRFPHRNNHPAHDNNPNSIHNKHHQQQLAHHRMVSRRPPNANNQTAPARNPGTETNEEPST